MFRATGARVPAGVSDKAEALVILAQQHEVQYHSSPGLRPSCLLLELWDASGRWEEIRHGQTLSTTGCACLSKSVSQHVLSLVPPFQGFNVHLPDYDILEHLPTVAA